VEKDRDTLVEEHKALFEFANKAELSKKVSYSIVMIIIVSSR
jgi:hypothetical protein